MAKRILITGVTGFVGQNLVPRLLSNSDYEIVVASRKNVDWLPLAIPQVRIGEIDASTDWHCALKEVDVVIHLAGRAHVMNETEDDPWLKFHSVNTLGSINLSRQSANSGVQRFIYISTIKVNGESTLPGQSFGADDDPHPSGLYASSKHEAEKGLLQLMEETKMEIVIIRPPLVYGPGVKANFLKMMKWARAGVPLPLGAIRNRRTLIAVDNLVDLLETCIEHPAAANQIFLAGDNEDLSTIDLIKKVGAIFGRDVSLVRVPVWLLSAAALITGKRETFLRLCSSLQIDTSKTRDLLNWEPPVSIDVALKQTVDHFRDN